MRAGTLLKNEPSQIEENVFFKGDLPIESEEIESIKKEGKGTKTIVSGILVSLLILFTSISFFRSGSYVAGIIGALLSYGIIVFVIYYWHKTKNYECIYKFMLKNKQFFFVFAENEEDKQNIELFIAENKQKKKKKPKQAEEKKKEKIEKAKIAKEDEQ